MSSNQAAWLTAPKALNFTVRAAPYTPPASNEVIVKTSAIAINPVDWMIQDEAAFPLTYPAIIGEDIAGEVVEIGSSASRFKKGDRVLGFAISLSSKRPCDGAFQEYVVLRENLATKIPDGMAFEKAAVMPLAVATASCILFSKDKLGLDYPSLEPTAKGKVVLIWGGSSSVGSMAIQLAVAAGYEVITTASPSHFDYVKGLGAAEVFDYHNPTVVNDIVKWLEGRTLVGTVAIISGRPLWQCIEVVQQAQAEKVVVTTNPSSLTKSEGVQIQSVLAFAIKDSEVSKVIYEDFLPKALEKGKLIPAPEPSVVGKGLDKIQDGIDAQRTGVHARKIVVTL